MDGLNIYSNDWNATLDGNLQVSKASVRSEYSTISMKECPLDNPDPAGFNYLLLIPIILTFIMIVAMFWFREEIGKWITTRFTRWQRNKRGKPAISKKEKQNGKTLSIPVKVVMKPRLKKSVA